MRLNFSLLPELTRRLGAGLAIVLLASCGGSDDGAAEVRLVNAVTDVGALSLFTEDDDERIVGVAPLAASEYLALGAGSYEISVRRSGSEATVSNSSATLDEGEYYTVVAWGRDGQVRLTPLKDDEDEPSATSAKLRIMHGAADAGAVDIYVASAGSNLDDLEPINANVASGSVGGYVTYPAGDLQLRVTAAGNRDDVRLNIPSLPVQGRQRLTLILQPSASGALVHGLVVLQREGVSSYRNSQSRVRLAAGVEANGAVAMRVGTTTVAAAAVSPSVGAYVLAPSGTQTLLAQVNGATLASESLNFGAGTDYTVLVSGAAASAQMRRSSDDNRPAATGRAKVRLAHGAVAFDTLSLTVDSVAVTSDLGYGAVSSFASVNANVGNAIIDVTSPLRTDPLYTTTRSNSSTTGVSLEAGSVYSLFMLGGGSAPRGFLRRDR